MREKCQAGWAVDAPRLLAARPRRVLERYPRARGRPAAWLVLAAFDSVQTVHLADAGPASPARSGRCARSRRGCSPSPRSRAWRWCSSATSPRREPWPVPGAGAPGRLGAVLRRGTRDLPECARIKTASARPMRSACSKCGRGGAGRCSNPSALFLAERPVGASGLGRAAGRARGRAAAARRGAGAGGGGPRGPPRRVGAGPRPLPGGAAPRGARAARGRGRVPTSALVRANVAGGFRLDELASDLAGSRAVGGVGGAGRRRSNRAPTVCFGEVGLAGEVRAVTGARARLRRGRPPRAQRL